jgi:hypothetical protein
MTDHLIKPVGKRNPMYNLPWLCNVFLMGFMMFNVLPRLENYYVWQCIPGFASIRDTLGVYVPIGVGVAMLNWYLAYRFKCRTFIAGILALALLLTTIAIGLTISGL